MSHKYRFNPNPYSDLDSSNTDGSDPESCLTDLRDDPDSDQDDVDECDPTHTCIACGTDHYIESAPGTDYTWCEECESVTTHRRMDYDE